MISHFRPVYPTHPLLLEHIYCYYTVTSESEDFLSRHHSFPHTYNAVSIYRGADLVCTPDLLKVEGCGDDRLSCVLQGKSQYPLLVAMSGAFSRITILFKPLGLNQFIRRPLSQIMGSAPRLFNAWELPCDFLTEKPVEQLESWLLGQYRPFNQPELKNALALLEDFRSEKSIDEIAAAIGLPLRTFNRLFLTHIGVSPVTHRRIARFRHSLENRLFHDQVSNLTEIGYQSNFYDQSYFIKLYNQLTGSNPSALFERLDRLGDSKLVFEFKK